MYLHFSGARWRIRPHVYGGRKLWCFWPELGSSHRRHHSLSTSYPQAVVAERPRPTISCGLFEIRIQRSRAPFGRPSLSRGGSPCLRSKTSGRIATGAPPARRRPSRHTHHRGEAANPTEATDRRPRPHRRHSRQTPADSSSDAISPPRVTTASPASSGSCGRPPSPARTARASSSSATSRSPRAGARPRRTWWSRNTSAAPSGHLSASARCAS